MDEFLSAAKRFEQDAEISLYDLGIALLLEYFAAPLLVFTGYQPLLRRPPAWESEIARLCELSYRLLPNATVMDEALSRIGHGLDRRRLMTFKINRMAIAIRCIVVLTHIGILLAVLCTSPWIGGGWLFAMAMAMVVCLKDHHWSPRGGFRRNPG